ncbi:MAG: hypothetical protein PHG85_02325 [Candidatus Altiarchaeota archaeon]|nr:hypothetical protein [Candidatus Altiarchaeota archaeon]
MKDKYLLMGIAASVMVLILALSLTLPTETQAQESAVMNFTVANVAPFITQVTCDTINPLQEGQDYNAWCFAEITDLNGWQDVAGCNGTLFKASALQFAAPNYNVRYVNTTCTLSGGTGMTVDCNCTFFMKYYADGNVIWTGNLTARDTSSFSWNTSNMTRSGGKLDELLALDLTRNSVILGSLQLGTTTSFNAGNFTRANNTGNVNQTLQVDSVGTVMDCVPSPADVPVGNIMYNVSLGAPSGAALADAAATVEGAWFRNRQVGTPGTVENRTIYWAVTVPTGINGTCSITIQEAAIAGSLT